MVHKKWTIKEELYSLNMQIREFGGPLRKLVYYSKNVVGLLCHWSIPCVSGHPQCDSPTDALLPHGCHEVGLIKQITTCCMFRGCNVDCPRNLAKSVTVEWREFLHFGFALQPCTFSMLHTCDYWLLNVWQNKQVCWNELFSGEVPLNTPLAECAHRRLTTKTYVSAWNSFSAVLVVGLA